MVSSRRSGSGARRTRRVKDAAGAVPARTTLHSVTGSAPLGGAAAAGGCARGAVLRALTVLVAMAGVAAR